MRFHVLGLAHLATTREFMCCAFTQKIRKLCKMLMMYNHEVFFYGGEGSTVDCTEFIPVISQSERESVYGIYDWKKEFFKYDSTDKAHKIFNTNTVEAIHQRNRGHDFLLCTQGTHHQWIAEHCSQMLICESGIGYSGIFANFKVFESYAWMHYLYGTLKVPDGVWYDAVIPNSYEVEDYPLCTKKQDYILFIGRLIERKGVRLAVDICKRANKKLIICGQGNKDEFITASDTHVEFFGYADVNQRAKLMGEAQCLLCPTYYIGPFEGVAVEAQLCGTPVITTDWGAFVETVIQGHTGYRCRIMGEFISAIDYCKDLSPMDCRQKGELYSMSSIACEYDNYFKRLATLWGDGFNTVIKKNA